MNTLNITETFNYFDWAANCRDSVAAGAEALIAQRRMARQSWQDTLALGARTGILDQHSDMHGTTRENAARLMRHCRKIGDFDAFNFWRGVLDGDRMRQRIDASEGRAQ